MKKGLFIGLIIGFILGPIVVVEGFGYYTTLRIKRMEQYRATHQMYYPAVVAAQKAMIENKKSEFLHPQ